jgi:GNAT superfamily N-acetyltransferase
MTNSGKTYTIERLGIHNIADLSRLHEAVYGRKQVDGFFENKYDTIYTGAKYVGYFAYNERHQAIAFYGVIPTLLWYNKRTVLTAQSADTMTHPDHRNKGLFTELANHTYALSKAMGISLVFGFPNQNSLPGLINKLDWQIAEVMDRFHIPVKGGLPLEKIAHKFPALRKAYSRYQQWILKGHLQTAHGITNSVLTGNGNGVYRDAGYLKYKTYSPTTVIKIEGVLFWIKLQNGIQIGDIENIGDNFNVAIASLRQLARKLGVAGIHFQISPDTPLHDLFAQYYQPEPSFPVIFKDLGYGLTTENIKFTLADIDIF